MFPFHFCLRHLVLRCLSTCFCAQTLGGPISFLLSPSALTDSCFPLPTTAVHLAVASCQALLRGRQLTLNVQIQDGTGRQPPEWVHGGFTCVKPTGNGLILFYLTVLNAVASKWLLLLTELSYVCSLITQNTSKRHERHLRLTDVKEGPWWNEKAPGYGVTRSRKQKVTLCISEEITFGR